MPKLAKHMISDPFKAAYNRLTEQSVKNRLSFWGRLFAFTIAILVLSALIIDYGFELDSAETVYINQLYEVAWWYYLISFTWGLVLDRFRIKPEKIILTVCMGTMLYLSAIAKMADASQLPAWIVWLHSFLTNTHYLLALIGFFAVVDASRAIVSFISSNTNPALLLAATFAILIFVGSVLLMVPRSTIEGYRLPWVDALFVSTSAVCVTGLSTVDISSTFTLEGQIILAFLIQIGGLGVMTITSFFAMFFMGSTGFGNQFALRDMVGSDTFSSLMSTLLYILGFTFIIELGGASLIWLDIHGTLGMTFREEVFFSLFHAISAFCNAGFSTLPGNLGNQQLICGHLPFYIIISMLVVLGGIGYPILVNFKHMIFYHIGTLIHRLRRSTAPRPKLKHLTNLNSKIVLTMTTVLLLGGTVAFALLEWNHTLGGFTPWGKITHAFFNSAVTRTAGFNSVNPAQFTLLTLLIYIFLMWIGGASQSTAGGIKVNTLAVAVGNFISVLRGRDSVVLFNREISAESVRRTFATIIGSLVIAIVSFMALTLLEPDIAPFNLFFEVVSALGTVGTSLNTTGALGIPGKLIITMLMFVGRVGLITVLTSLLKPAGSHKYRYPKDHVIIN